MHIHISYDYHWDSAFLFGLDESFVIIIMIQVRTGMEPGPRHAFGDAVHLESFIIYIFTYIRAHIT